MEIRCALVIALSLAACTRSASVKHVDASVDAASDSTVDAARDAELGCGVLPSVPAEIGLGLPTPADGTSMTVHVVSSHRLTLSPSSGTAVSFHWSGPALPFEEGETVTVTTVDAWRGIAGASGTALVFQQRGFVLGEPPGNPGVNSIIGLSRSEACAAPDSVTSTCGQPKRDQIYYSVALWGLDQHYPALPGESTELVFGWRLTNVISVQMPSYASPPSDGGSGCIVEAGSIEILTALGPPP